MKCWGRSIGVGMMLAVVSGCLSAVLVLLMPTETIAQQSSEESEESEESEAEFIRPRTTCPETLETLMPLLLRDLPSYANRVSQRAYIDEFRITPNIPGTIIAAGRPDYEPIELASREYLPQQEDATQQAFFTTLERQYAVDTIVDLEHYHWLFLTHTQTGWRLVLLFSTIGDHPPDEPPTPPQDTSQGVVAQAIRLWLRDCRAGRIVAP